MNKTCPLDMLTVLCECVNHTKLGTDTKPQAEGIPDGPPSLLLPTASADTSDLQIDAEVRLLRGPLFGTRPPQLLLHGRRRSGKIGIH